MLSLASINSFYQTGLKNLLDVAVLAAELKIDKAYSKVDEIPFDFTRRRPSVVDQDHDHHRLICKRAVEEILAVCKRVRDAIPADAADSITHDEPTVRLVASGDPAGMTWTTAKVPFIQSRAAWPVLILTGLLMVCGIVIPFTALGTKLGLEALPASYFAWLTAILLCYSVLTQFVKGWYIRRFGTWL